jgi:5-formyltetrahydrofolate cyclo-ligase
VTKKELRQKLRQMLAAIAPDELHRRSIQACARLAETREYTRAEIIMVFLSLPHEADTTPLVLQAWRNRKRVLAPKVSWEQRRMLPVEIRSLSDDVSESPLGIREPGQGVPIPVSEIDLVVVPGLGYDPQGNRLGRGRGFYDRFLSHPDWHGVACGFALETQIVDHVPTEEQDRPVNLLITESAVRRFNS